MVCPFSIKGNARNREFATFTYGNIILYLTQCILYCVSTTYALARVQIVPLEYIRAFFNIFTSFLCIFLGFLHRKNTIKTLRLLVELENKIRNIGIVIKYGNVRKVVSAKLIIRTTLHLLIIVVASAMKYYPLDQMFNVASMIGSHVITSLFLDQFLVFVLILRHNLRMLNEFLESNYYFISTENYLDIFQCYNLTRQLAEIINANYGVALLFGIGTAFFNSTTYIYSSLRFDNVVLPQFLFLTMQIFLLIEVPNICHMCMDQVSTYYVFRVLSKLCLYFLGI